MNTFRLNEVAVFQNGTTFPQYNGTECVIVGALHLRESAKHPGSQFPRYLVRARDGRRFAVSPDSLRKKQSPHFKAWCDALEVIDRVSDPMWAAQ